MRTMARLDLDISGFLAQRARWTPLEIAFWVFALASIWLFPTKHLILTQIAILALFALSLDLILGYAGIISLGQAAFFGFGQKDLETNAHAEKRFIDGNSIVDRPA